MKFPYLIPPIGFIEIVDLSFPGKTMLFLKQRKQLAAKIKSTLFNDRQFQFFLFFICCCENAGRSCPLKYALIRLFFLCICLPLENYLKNLEIFLSFGKYVMLHISGK